MSQFRNIVRLSSALVLLTYLVCHMTAHVAVLISLDTAEGLANILTRPWTQVSGYILLSLAFWLHYTNALWSIYLRRTLNLMPGKLWQLILGLAIPFVLIPHAAGTSTAQTIGGVIISYRYELWAQWVAAPWKAALQIFMLLILWTHASIGLYFWLRASVRFAQWRPYLIGFGLIFPTLAFSGYVSGGMQVVALSQTPGFVDALLSKAHATPQSKALADHAVVWALAIHSVLIALPFALVFLRRWRSRRAPNPVYLHIQGKSLFVHPGATVLETLRSHNIPHASVCGGQGRCTTCRVLVHQTESSLHPPNTVEAEALKRISAQDNCRLACQITPTSDLWAIPLVPPAIGHTARNIRGSLAGKEKFLSVMFVDIRSFTTLNEILLPYDVLFILNQFFVEMTEALDHSHGHYSQFTGDGLMALYGHDSDDSRKGVRDALSGAVEMLMRLQRLNDRIAQPHLPPLKIGIGIHFGVAIVGAMGPPNSLIFSAIGDTVNTTARLESLTKEYQCSLILSKAAAQTAQLDLSPDLLHAAPVKGKTAPVEFYALHDMESLSALLHQMM